MDLGFVCPHRFAVQGPDAATLSLPYCAGDPIPQIDPATGAPPRSALRYRRLVIAQHGRGSDGQDYYDHLRDAANQSGVLNETFIIAPQFLTEDEICSNGLYLHADYGQLLTWEGSGISSDWAIGGLSEGTIEDPAPFQRSSYAVLEELIRVALEALPNVTTVVFAGQSAGGQLTQRFAAFNTVEPEFPGVRFRYFPANPQSHMFMGPERPVWNAATQSFDFEVPACAEADDYFTGLQDREGRPYIEDLSNGQIQAQYARRSVVYLVGEADIEPPDPSPGCRFDVQGPNRRERSRGMHAHVRFRFGADHGFQVVPDVAHGGGILRHECARRHLFEQYQLCNQDEYQGTVGGAELPASSYATDIAFGNVDADPQDEIGIAFDQESGIRILVLDDARNGHAVLHEAGADWGNGTRATTIAFGDIDGDGRDELAYGRQSNGGRRYWIVDDATAQFATLVGDGGTDWGDDFYPTDLAFGDVDGDVREELAIARRASSGNRVFVVDDASAGFGVVFAHGSDWGDGAYATGVALGDVDGTDAARELAFTRVGPADSPRVFVFDDAGAGFGWLYSGGDWGMGRDGTAVAMGDLDDDGRAEIAVARRASNGAPRVFVMDDATRNFATLASIGSDWGDDYDATSIAIGDRAGSSPRTLAVGRSDGGTAARILVYDVSGTWTDDDGGSWRTPFSVTSLRSLAEDWGQGAFTRTVAFGDTDGWGRDELGWARRHDVNARWGIVHDL